MSLEKLSKSDLLMKQLIFSMPQGVYPGGEEIPQRDLFFCKKIFNLGRTAALYRQNLQLFCGKRRACGAKAGGQGRPGRTVYCPYAVCGYSLAKIPAMISVSCY